MVIGLICILRLIKSVRILKTSGAMGDGGWREGEMAILCFETGIEDDKKNNTRPGETRLTLAELMTLAVALGRVKVGRQEVC